jgi:hypothetical protein
MERVVRKSFLLSKVMCSNMPALSNRQVTSLSGALSGKLLQMSSISMGQTQDQWAKLHKSPDVAESGGEENNTANDFARHWAIAHIAEALINEVDEYVILFEYLQDIAILDSPQAPTKIALYQMKKRSQPPWTKSSLTATKSSVPKGKKQQAVKSKTGIEGPKSLKGRSILGKLYYAVDSASSLTNASGVLLTDGQFNLNGPDDQRITPYSKTPLNKLCNADVEFLGKQLKKELGSDELTHLGSLQIEQTRMNPAGMREYVRGVISEFLEKKFPHKPNVSGALMERMLQQFGKLSGTTPNCDCLDDLVRYKGFTKTQFINLVTESIPAKSWDEKLASLVADLKAEGVSNKLADKWHDRAVSVHTSVVLTPERALVYDWELVSRIARDTAELSYKSTVEQITDALRTEALTLGREPLNNIELAAVALVAILDVQTESTSSDKELTEGQQ